MRGNGLLLAVRTSCEAGWNLFYGNRLKRRKTLRISIFSAMRLTWSGCMKMSFYAFIKNLMPIILE